MAIQRTTIWAESNLVDNAIIYSQPGADQWVRIATGLSLDGSAYLRVIDNGAGIAPEHLPRLFDRFYRVDSARSHNPDEEDPGKEIPGSGLGLSIAQWIAQMHGGGATVSSQPGEETTFEIQIPL